MESQKPISNAPMILGIIGGIIGLPSALCSGACAAGITAMSETSTQADVNEAGSVFMWMGLIGAIIGFIGAFMYKKKPGLWGALLLVAGLLCLLNLVTMNMMALIPAILFIIAGAIALAQKKKMTVVNS